MFIFEFKLQFVILILFSMLIKPSFEILGLVCLKVLYSTFGPTKMNPLAEAVVYF